MAIVVWNIPVPAGPQMTEPSTMRMSRGCRPARMSSRRCSWLSGEICESEGCQSSWISKVRKSSMTSGYSLLKKEKVSPPQPPPCNQYAVFTCNSSMVSLATMAINGSLLRIFFFVQYQGYDPDVNLSLLFLNFLAENDRLLEIDSKTENNFRQLLACSTAMTKTTQRFSDFRQTGRLSLQPALQLLLLSRKDRPLPRDRRRG